MSHSIWGYDLRIFRSEKESCIRRRICLKIWKLFRPELKNLEMKIETGLIWKIVKAKYYWLTKYKNVINYSKIYETAMKLWHYFFIAWFIYFLQIIKLYPHISITTSLWSQWHFAQWHIPLVLQFSTLYCQT